MSIHIRHARIITHASKRPGYKTLPVEGSAAWEAMKPRKGTSGALLFLVGLFVLALVL